MFPFPWSEKVVLETLVFFVFSRMFFNFFYKCIVLWKRLNVCFPVLKSTYRESSSLIYACGIIKWLHGQPKKWIRWFLVEVYLFVLQENLVTERKEKPVSMNAFELISRSQSFNLENLFGKQAVCFTRFISFQSC